MIKSAKVWASSTARTQSAAEHAEAEGFLFSDFNRSDDNTRCGVIKSAKVCILAPLIFGRGK